MGMENYKRGILSGLEKMKNNNIEERDISENTVLDIVNSNEIQTFDYSIVDRDTAEFLHQKEVKITQIRLMSWVAIGKELNETFAKFAKVGYGEKTKLFDQWVQSIGISPRGARNYINAYNYVMENFHNIEDAEKIQPSLLFAISKPSAPLELQEMVLSGDITTHKQYKELEEKLKAAEKEASEAKLHYDTISESYGRLEKVNNKHYEKAKKLEEELDKVKQQLNDDTEIATAVVEKVPDEVLEELAELRSAEVRILLKELNSNILNLSKMLSNVDYKDMVTIMKYRSYIEPIKENMMLLKKVSLENLKIDLFDFIKD